MKKSVPAVMSAEELTIGPLLTRNMIWNLVGTCLPALVAIFSLPILERNLGTERLGVIALAWAVLGYFGLLDFGLSRALTKLVAQRLGERRFEQIVPLIWSSLILLFGIGIVAALLTFLSASWLVTGIFKVPIPLQSETLHALYWVSGSLPAVLVTAGLRGMLEAFQKFRLATAIRVPLGIFGYLGPVLVLPFSRNIAVIIAVLVSGRIIAGILHFWACLRVFPQLRRNFLVDGSEIGSLVRFGGWVTVSNVLGPVMATFDRFVIGAMLSLSAVAYYAVPMEMVAKFSLIPAAIAGVLFPAFSAIHAADARRLSSLLKSGTRWIVILLLPLTIAIVAFAPELLRIWLGADFARQSTSVVRWLAVAVLINGVGYLPFAHIQADGRPDLTAKLHLAELPIYVVVLLVFMSRMGIEGAAIAWFARTAIDTSILLASSKRLLLQTRSASAA